MQNRNPKKGWTPSWSGRGTAILDTVERNSKKVSLVPVKKIELTTNQKLKKLILKLPARKFYHELVRQMLNYPLSKLQIEIINRDYYRYFQKK